jgi:hypothetical protein
LRNSAVGRPADQLRRAAAGGALAATLLWAGLGCLLWSLVERGYPRLFVIGLALALLVGAVRMWRRLTQ